MSPSMSSPRDSNCNGNDIEHCQIGGRVTGASEHPHDTVVIEKDTSHCTEKSPLTQHRHSNEASRDEPTVINCKVPQESSTPNDEVLKVRSSMNQTEDIFSSFFGLSLDGKPKELCQINSELLQDTCVDDQSSYLLRQEDDEFDEGDSDETTENEDIPNCNIDGQTLSIDERKTLIEKTQVIVSVVKVQEFEFFCPLGVRRKIMSLVNIKFVNFYHQLKFMRLVIGIGYRVTNELLVRHSDPHRILATLWIAVRERGCQFLGPALQEEILRLVAFVMECGVELTRKVLTMYILQRLQPKYPSHATKSSIGHVIQILYRAGCFELIRRPNESSLMVLKEHFRNYEDLRREHDSQLVEIALNAGIKLSPEQWSSVLYGDDLHVAHMQSIQSKLNGTLPPFDRLVKQLAITMSELEDHVKVVDALPHLENLVQLDRSLKESPQVCSFENMVLAIESMTVPAIKLISFIGYMHNTKGMFSYFKNPMKNHFF